MLKYLLVISLFMNFAHAQSAFTPAEAQVLKKEAMKGWESRDDETALEQALSKLEKVHETYPQDLEVIYYLVRGYYLLAEYHLTNDDLKKRTFEKARQIGESGLMLNEGYRKYKDDDIEKAIDKLTEKEVPVLYWSAASLGRWSKLNGIMSSLKFKNQILSMVKKVEKLNPNYFHGAVYRYWGSFYAIAPSIAGGDIKKSKKYFDKAIKSAPENLGHKVSYAELYLVEKKDKKEFKRVLHDVLSAPKGPESIAPENFLEKRKAEKLLEKEDELF